MHNISATGTPGKEVRPATYSWDVSSSRRLQFLVALPSITSIGLYNASVDFKNVRTFDGLIIYRFKGHKFIAISRFKRPW